MEGFFPLKFSADVISIKRFVFQTCFRFVTAVDMQLPGTKLDHPMQVNTAHGVTSVEYLYTVTFRMYNGSPGKPVERCAQFLGFKNLKTQYPGYKIQIPASIRQKYKVNETSFAQPPGAVTFIVGGGTSLLFPRTVVHEGNIVLARSAFTGRLLCMGAKLEADAKPAMKVANAMQARPTLNIDLDPAMDCSVLMLPQWLNPYIH